MDQQLNSFKKAVEKELKKAEVNFKQTKKAAQEVAASAAASPSQSGDRFHSQGAADLAKQKYEAVLALKNEIDQKGEKVCVDHGGETLYLVDNPIMISGLKIVSTKSPLSLKLLGNN